MYEVIVCKQLLPVCRWTECFLYITDQMVTSVKRFRAKRDKRVKKNGTTLMVDVVDPKEGNLVMRDARRKFNPKNRGFFFLRVRKTILQTRDGK